MKVLLAGATGVIGRQFLPLLIDAGHSVVALTRSEDRAGTLSRAGVEPLVCDVVDRDRLLGALGDTREMAASPKMSVAGGSR